MGNKYLINVVGDNLKVSYNAVAKPRQDVERTLVRNGYEVINIPYVKDLPAWRRLPLHLYHIYKTVVKLKAEKPQNIIIQYPGLRIGSKSITYLTKFLKNLNVTILIHDIDSLRVYGQISEREIKTLNNVKSVIVHTDNMMGYLKEQGVTSEMKPLWLFDYYANGGIIKKDVKNDNSVIFAGNLNKSEFLKKIGDSLLPVKLNLYGLPIEYKWPDGLIYKGKFAPDEISDIEGSWGLVWDGDSLDTCNGQMGEYLKFNSSHKAALYIASGKPVIVWEQSGIAPFIIKNNLGISISSLRELPAKLSKLSEKNYGDMLDAVGAFQVKIRNGKMLEDVVDKF